MQHRKLAQNAPTMTRDQTESLGPWDLRRIEIATATRPFWADWKKDRLDAIDDLGVGATLRAGHAKVAAFDYRRLPHAGSWDMTEEQEAAYVRFQSWQVLMADAGLSRYVPMIIGAVLEQAECTDQAVFERAIDLHVRVRILGIARRLRQEPPLYLKRKLAETKRLDTEETQRRKIYGLRWRRCGARSRGCG